MQDSKTERVAVGLPLESDAKSLSYHYLSIVTDLGRNSASGEMFNNLSTAIHIRVYSGCATLES